eukprot:ANDGO_06998.mRNA.1 Pyruvate kinase
MEDHHLFAPDPSFQNLTSFKALFGPLEEATAKKFARSTKIMITAGPSCVDCLQELIDRGLNAIRFNMAYELSEHQRFLDALRKCRGYENVCLVADLMGRGIRTGKMKNPSVKLHKGQKFTLWQDQSRIGDECGVSFSFPELPRLARVGDKIFLANGAVALDVERVSRSEIECQVMLDGDLEENKGIQIRNVRLPGSAVSAKDKTEIEWVIKNKFDYVALSFINDVDDVLEIKSYINNRGPRVIAKIETKSALQNVSHLIGAADAIQISRGDLAVAVQARDLTSVQKDIIRRCNLAGTPVVLASQLLTTMVANPRPTRAECTDSMNAAFDGVDCLLMTNETAKGTYPVDAFKTMDRLLKQADAFLSTYGHQRPEFGVQLKHNARMDGFTVEEAVAAASVNFARDLKMPGIITLTESGRSALYVAKYRPPCPVFCCTPIYSTARRLGIVKGCHTILLPESLPEEYALKTVVNLCRNVGAVHPGETVVVTLGSQYRQSGGTDCMSVVHVAKEAAE